MNRIAIVHRHHPDETAIFLAVLRTPNLPRDLISGTQAEFSNLRLRYVDIKVAVLPADVPAQEAVALVDVF